MSELPWGPPGKRSVSVTLLSIVPRLHLRTRGSVV